VTIEQHPFRRLLGIDVGVVDHRDLDAAATRAASAVPALVAPTVTR
jgi:hypothetical protein